MEKTINGVEVPNVTYTESDAYLTLNDVDKIMDTLYRDNKVYTKGSIIFYTQVEVLSLAKIDDDKYILRFILPFNPENIYHNVCIGYSKLHDYGEVSLLGIKFDDIEGVRFSPKEWLKTKEIMKLYKTKKDLIDLIS